MLMRMAEGLDCGYGGGEERSCGYHNELVGKVMNCLSSFVTEWDCMETFD